MTNPPAGSKSRATVYGHIIMATPEVVRHLRRLASGTLNHLFLQAREQGAATISIDDEVWTISRLPDHTFSIDKISTHRFSL